MLPGITWTIAGKPVPIQDFSAGSEANLGFGQMRGTLRASDARSLPTTVKQGAIIRASTDDGRIFYQGRISGPPTIQRGLAVIAAQGEGARAVKRSTRLPYQIRAYDVYTDMAGNPHNYASNPTKFAISNSGALVAVLAEGGTINAGEYNGYAFWVPGATITRVAATWGSSFIDADFRWELFVGAGPSGATTNDFNQGMSGFGGTFDRTLATTADHILLLFARRNTSSVVGPGATLLRDLRINCIAPGDTFTGSQVVTDVGGRLGYDTSGVISTGLNVLPLDWASGSWADLLTYIANMEDRVWGVYEDNQLTYAAWGEKEWTCYQAHGAKVDLTQLEIFNGVTVKYKDVGGSDREVTLMADPDPLAGTGMINIYPAELADVQADSTVVTQVAGNLLPQVSSVRYVGRVETPHLWDSRMRDAPYEGRPGATLRVPDFAEGAMRIASVDYTRTGVILGIEAPVSAFGAIRQSELETLRRPSTMGLPELPPGPGEPVPSDSRAAWFAHLGGQGTPLPRGAKGHERKKPGRKYF